MGHLKITLSSNVLPVLLLVSLALHLSTAQNATLASSYSITLAQLHALGDTIQIHQSLFASLVKAPVKLAPQVRSVRLARTTSFPVKPASLKLLALMVLLLIF